MPILQKVGYYLVADLKDVKAQKLQQQIGEVIKKYKLDTPKPSVQDIEGWHI